MISLAKHIEILLLEHDCVVVPGFGGFITNYVEAQTEQGATSLLYPPVRTVRFNQSLRENDGLLVHSYMTAYDAAYPAALKQLQMEVDDMVDRLTLDGEFRLENIGLLRLDIQQRVTLEGDESGITTPALYGLSSIAVQSLAELEKQRELAEQLAQTTIVPIVKAEPASADDDEDGLTVHIQRRWVDLAIAAAASVVLFFLFSYPAMHQPMGTDVCEAGTIRVERPKAKAPHVEKQAPFAVVSATPEPTSFEQQEAPAASAPSAKAEVPAAQPVVAEPFSIVLASYVNRANAEEYIGKLSKQGFGEARFEQTGRINRVLYSHYADKASAESALRDLRQRHPDFREAWVLELQ